MLHQVKALVKVGRVDDGEYRIGRLRALHAAENHVDGDLFFERVGAEPMRTRQIDELDRAVISLERTDVFFDRDARVVAGLLSQAGQAIEKGALARIRIADDRDAGRRMPAY